MKSLKFEKGWSLQVTYRTPREGPPSYLIYTEGCSQIALTKEQVLKAARWPRSTETGSRLRTWLDEIEAGKEVPEE